MELVSMHEFKKLSGASISGPIPEGSTPEEALLRCAAMFETEVETYCFILHDSLAMLLACMEHGWEPIETRGTNMVGDDQLHPVIIGTFWGIKKEEKQCPQVGDGIAWNQHQGS